MTNVEFDTVSAIGFSLENAMTNSVAISKLLVVISGSNFDWKFYETRAFDN